MSEHRIEEMLSHFNGDYKDWRSSLDKQMQTSLGTDDLIDLVMRCLEGKQLFNFIFYSDTRRIDGQVRSHAHYR